jgi:hypothetical protein
VIDPRASFVAGIENVILEEAQRAAAAAAAAPTGREAAGKTIAAIVLAVAAVEAQSGTWAALFKGDYGVDDVVLRSWRRRSPDQIVKDIVKRVEPSSTVGRNKWHQHLVALVRLRNVCAHYYPEFLLPGTWPPLIEPYVKNGTFTVVGDDTMDWTSRILVPRTAAAAVEYALEAMTQFTSAAWKDPTREPGLGGAA